MNELTAPDAVQRLMLGATMSIIDTFNGIGAVIVNANINLLPADHNVLRNTLRSSALNAATECRYSNIYPMVTVCAVIAINSRNPSAATIS